jgi:hypothetical protein
MTGRDLDGNLVPNIVRGRSATIKIVTATRRQLLHAAVLSALSPFLHAARKEFWETQDPATWSSNEKDLILYRSPWARDGFARLEDKKEPTIGYNKKGERGVDLPDPSPSGPPGGVKSVPIGQEIPPVPKSGGDPLQFHVLARWETAQPVRLAGGPEVPEMTGQFYVIRLRGLPLMPPPKTKPGDPPPPDPNEGILHAIEVGTRLERPGKNGIRCEHLFKGWGDTTNEVLLFFPHGADPITLSDKTVTLESRFSVFHLSIKFPLKEMFYKGQLAL